jgi:catechol 2,3-dioxygenase-like lactoylglutathione lyase family enzyme
MSDDNPSAISHVSLGSNRYDEARAFYDVVLATLGIHRLMEHGDAAAYGKAYPEFWIQRPIDGAPATLGNGTHVGFIATSRAQVEAFYATAVAAGAQGDGPPGPRPHYGEPYYGCFVRDLDGHKIEAAFWDESLAGPDGH